jgi:hypothetical protein
LENQDAVFQRWLSNKAVWIKAGLKIWIFCAGRLFHSPDEWWSNRGWRDHPHESIDLCLYKVLQSVTGEGGCLMDDTKFRFETNSHAKRVHPILTIGLPNHLGSQFKRG